MDKKWLRNSFVYLIILVAIIALVFTVFQPGPGRGEQPLSLTQVAAMIKRGEVKTIEVNDDKLTLQLASGGQASARKERGESLPQTLQPFGVTPEDLSRVDIRVNEPPQFTNWLGLVVNLLPLIFFGAILLFMMRQAQGSNNQALSFGKSRARMFMGNKPTITFADVAGVEEAKQELAEVVEFLKYPEKFSALGARIPKGVLLVGPPGTGKTLLSRAVAGEAGVPFFSISGSEFVEMFVGVGASRVRDLFDQAKRNAPCIVFIDEIDAVGRQRGAGLGGSHDEREQTLNQILVEMDGFDTNTNVIVLAATNRPDVLDPALLRPGRFDRRVVLDNSDIRGRKAILDVHTKGKPLSDDVNLDVIARQTPGFSGADLANLINEGAILAARRNKKTIGMSELEEALERIVAGPERKSRVISDEEKQIIAYHEGGHAVVQRVLPKCDPVNKVTIVARGMAMGVTWSLPQEDRYFRTRREFEDDIAAALGGWVAEQLHLGGDATTGASNDIEKATEMARQMVTKFGMSEKLGPLQYGKTDELIFLGRQIQEEKNYSEETSKLIDSEVHEIVDRARRRAYELLTQYRSLLDAVVGRLIEQETLSSDEFNQLVDGHLGQQPVAAAAPDQLPPGAPAGEERRREKGEKEKGKGPAPAPT